MGSFKDWFLPGSCLNHHKPSLKCKFLCLLSLLAPWKVYFLQVPSWFLLKHFPCLPNLCLTGEFAIIWRANWFLLLMHGGSGRQPKTLISDKLSDAGTKCTLSGSVPEYRVWCAIYVQCTYRIYMQKHGFFPWNWFHLSEI